MRQHYCVLLGQAQQQLFLRLYFIFSQVFVLLQAYILYVFCFIFVLIKPHGTLNVFGCL